MKAVYLFIVLFLAWCVICIRWYVFSVKGLPADPAHFNPDQTTMAIVEIIFMVLVAFLLGFAIAWLLRETTIKQKQMALQHLHIEKVTLLNAQNELRTKLEKEEAELNQAQDRVIKASRENERLRTELEVLKKDEIQFQTELEIIRPKMKEIEGELSLLRFRIRQSEQQMLEKDEASKKILRELTECREQRRYEREEPVFSDFISGQRLGGISEATEDDRDDLKAIKGIGPSIERKLNSQGIFTFKQISELTEETIPQVAEAIEFFPGRITRDRWIEQASRLYLEKLRS